MISCDNNGINTKTLNGEKQVQVRGLGEAMEHGTDIRHIIQKFKTRICCCLSYAGVDRLDRLRIIHSVYTKKLILLQRERGVFWYINKLLILFSASPVFKRSTTATWRRPRSWMNSKKLLFFIAVFLTTCQSRLRCASSSLIRIHSGNFRLSAKNVKNDNLVKVAESPHV